VGQISENIANLWNTSVLEVLEDKGVVTIRFSNGTRLAATHWRVSLGPLKTFSSFDQIQIPELARRILESRVTRAKLCVETGDLEFEFDSRIHMQIFNFTDRTVWEIRFPDGTGRRSKHVKTTD
jgi:hypothetical protein